MYEKEIQDIIDKLQFMEKFYDQIRVVDPLRKKIITREGNEVIENHMGCFAFFGKNKPCDNCVSMRAYSKNQTFVKLEYTPDAIYMLTAIPVQLSNRIVVIELLKNITESMVYSGLEGENQQQDMHKMIDGMNRLASRDSLTGIYNRRFISEKLPADIINAALSYDNIAVIMADIDLFKLVNDTYGHLAGDYVLKTFAEILSRNLKRKSDWVARYGGEEFIVIIPGAEKEFVIETAERMRNDLENTQMEYEGLKFRVTASFGICHIQSSDEVKAESIIACADKKLYEAKNNGRNRTEV